MINGLSLDVTIKLSTIYNTVALRLNEVNKASKQLDYASRIHGWFAQTVGQAEHNLHIVR